MTGRELIEHIQKNDLLDYDFPICGENGAFVGYISIEDAYKKYRIPISKMRKSIRENNIKLVNVLGKELIKKEDMDKLLSNDKQGDKSFKWKKERAKA